MNRALLALAATVLVAACAQVAPGASVLPGAPADAQSLEQRMLDATEVTFGGEDLLSPGAYLQVSFNFGTIDVNASDCHYLSGRYAVDEGVLAVEITNSVRVGCGPVSDDRDWWFARFLDSQPMVSTDGSTVWLANAETLVGITDHAERAIWERDPGFEITPETRTLNLLVTETACASGQSPVGRILEPTIGYSAELISISINILVVGGAATCQGNAPYPLMVDLREPVGIRRIVDGGSHPPDVDATPTPFAGVVLVERSLGAP